MGASFKIKNTIDVSHLYKMSKQYFYNAQYKAAIQMLDWMSSGSAKSPKKPPRRTGVLASSGSVFYKNKLIGTTPDVRTSEAEKPATPNKEHQGENVTWGFNTDYAKRMHEDKNLKPGPLSISDPNSSPGNQWMLEHLKKDAKNYMKLIAEFIKGLTK